jgi:hypothetical protein
MMPITDTPVVGFYTTRLVKNGPPVPIEIWFGQPIVDGEEQDRSPRWCVAINGETDRLERDDGTGYRCRVALDPMQVWPHCARDPISADEYRFLLRRRAWALEHAPDHPAARPRQPVDLRSLKPAF